MLSRRQLLGAGVTLVAGGCDHAVEAEVKTAHRVELAVRHISQEAQLHAPTAASIIAAYYGDDHHPRKLKSLAAGKTWDEALPFNDFTVTLYDDLLRGMDQLGYGWTERRFAQTPQGLTEGLAETPRVDMATAIQASLAEGRPVLADVSVPHGHAFVIRGFEAERRLLYIVDPKAPAPGRYTMTYDQFGAVWNETAYGRTGRYLILTSPRNA